MSNNPSNFEEGVFAGALALPPSEWSPFVRRACGGDAELCARVEALLRGHTMREGAFDNPAPAAVAGVGRALQAEADAQIEPERIGRYRLQEKIGEGGFGVVWLAEQREPVKRQVALKIIRPGMDSKEVIARFEVERQALALMDHPNIAKVLDAGTTETGRPFFVMELVRGVTITKYCDEQNLPTHARLELFTQVCHAVQHAHQKGIIHRDIKPSNILVTLRDGVAVPKVIDFGIAKATAGGLIDNTVFTAFEQFMGTPAYMSPEQAELSSFDIDTRTDIYSLGILLYELLTGRPPFDPKSLAAAGLLEIRRVIREVEPPRPSTRLNTLNELDRATIAKQRGIEPAQLSTLLRRDLDWIVMRCLEKDRVRRYATANALAIDVLRHLHDEPVVARPASAGYRLRKMMRRHRVAFVATTAVAVALIGGIVVSTLQAFRANRAEKIARSEAARANVAERNALSEAERANTAREVALSEAQRANTAEKNARGEAERAKAAEVNAQSEADRATTAEKRALSEAERANTAEIATREKAAIAKAVNDFLLVDLLRQTDSSAQMNAHFVPNPNLTMREALDRAAENVGTRFPQQPLTEAVVRSVIGSTYMGLGDATKAAQQHEQAYQLRTRVLGPEHHDTLASANSLAFANNRQAKAAAAAALLTETTEIQARVLGPEHRDTLASKGNLAGAYRTQGKYTEAVALYEQTVEERKRALGPEHHDTLSAMQNLASVYNDQGKYAKAEELLNQILPTQKRVFGEEHPTTLSSMNSLGLIYYSQGKYAAAETLHTRVLEARRRVLGVEHTETLGSMNNLAMAYERQNKLREAAALYATTAVQMTRVLGPEDPYTLNVMHNLAAAYFRQGKVDASAALHEETLAIRRRVLGPEAPNTLKSMASLAVAYQRQGKLADAAILDVETLAISERVLGNEHPETLRSMLHLANVYRAQNKLPESARLAAQCLEIRKRVLAVDHRDTLQAMYDLALIYDQMNDLPNGEKVCREFLAGRLRTEPVESTPLAAARFWLGANLVAQQKFAEAEPILRAALAVREKRMAGNWHTYNNRSFLGGSLAGQKKFAEAEPPLTTGYEGMKRQTLPMPNPAHFKQSLERLVQLYTDWGKPEKAAAWKKKLEQHVQADAEKLEQRTQPK